MPPKKTNQDYIDKLRNLLSQKLKSYGYSYKEKYQFEGLKTDIAVVFEEKVLAVFIFNDFKKKDDIKISTKLKKVCEESYRCGIYIFGRFKNRFYQVYPHGIYQGEIVKARTNIDKIYSDINRNNNDLKYYLKNDDTLKKSIAQIKEISEAYKDKFGEQFDKLIFQELNYTMLKFSRGGNILFSEDLSPDCFENKLFKSILKQPASKIYRYMSLNTFVDIITSGKILVGSILGMNDKSEIYHFDKNYDKDKYVENIIQPNNFKYLNSLYLSCYTNDTKIDNLTMWRLYADEAKGICVEFEPTDKIRNGFYLAQVEYGNKDDSPAYEYIKQITGFNPKFYDNNLFLKSLAYWKYFLKSKDYEDEAEVRLLIHHDRSDRNIKKEWGLKYGIPVPYLLIPLRELPFQISKITIGPKAIEKVILERQIRILLDEKEKEIPNSKNIQICTSKIDNYR